MSFAPTPFCACCDRTYRKIDAHLRTKKHQRNAETIEATKLECEICNSPAERFVKCSRCVHYWCVTCQPQLDRCPFCRLGPPVPSRNLATSTRLSQIRPRVRRIFMEMERWRRRICPRPEEQVLVRLSWMEMGCVTHLVASSAPFDGFDYPNPSPPVNRLIPSTYQIMIQMERWRLRLPPNPYENVLIRLSWNEVAYITFLFLNS